MARPSHLPGSCRLPPPASRSRGAWSPRAPAPASTATPRLFWMCHGDAQRSLLLPLLSLDLTPLSALSLFLATERSLSLPFADTAATGHQTPHRRVPGLRFLALKLSAKPSIAVQPASPSPSSSSTSAARDRRRPLATSNVSPEPLGLQSTPCKPRHRSPLPPFSFARSGRRFHQGRNPPPHELDAGVTPVTIWSRTSVQRTRGCTQSMASALVGSFARCNTKPATHPNSGRR